MDSNHRLSQQSELRAHGNCGPGLPSTEARFCDRRTAAWRCVLSRCLRLIGFGSVPYLARVKHILPVSCLTWILIFGSFNAAHPLPGGGGDRNCLLHTRASFNVSPATIYLGQSATLSWAVSPPDDCAVSLRVVLNGQSYGLGGHTVVHPMATASYGLNLISSGAGVSGARSLGPVTVTVNLPKTVYINGSTDEWKRLLIQALVEGNHKIILAPNVDMDLSGYEEIWIHDNVTLTSELPPPGPIASAAVPGDRAYRLARDARNLGPRLFTNTRPKPLFRIAGDNVKIEGFRIHGPNFGLDDDTPLGISINSHVGIEITDMELAGWSGAAITVQEDDAVPGRLTREHPEMVSIHDNFIHHNVHHGAEGYGVSVTHGAYALIERNVFDFNRHAIMGTANGEQGTGYFARQNLILKGGTWDGACLPHTSLCVTTHEFDVHGSNDCLFIGHSCGQAGEYFEMTENAFQYTMGYSIKFRGNPINSALVGYNVFASSEDDAIDQNGTGIFSGVRPIQRRANVFGVDTYGKYGVCDFDGDGIDDLFLATGVSWWYMSGANRHWVYLKSSTERLEQLGLGDFDGDHRCDVLSSHGSDLGIYPGGTGDWRSLGFGVPFSELRFGDFNGDGVMDIFRRAPDGQWWIISPGHYGWTPIQSSSFPLSELRFGDFNGDHITDVIALVNGRWSVSWGGRTGWQPLNSLKDSLQSVLIADIDHDGKDDILRYRVLFPGLLSNSPGRSVPGRGVWEVSWGGQSGWKTLQELEFAPTPDHPRPATNVFGLVGRFRSGLGADLVSVDPDRIGHVYDIGSKQFLPHSLYAY